MAASPDDNDGGPDGADASAASEGGPRLKGIFLGSKLRIFGTIVLSLIVLVALGFVLGVFGVPAVDSIDNRFGEVNQSTTTIETGLQVRNPNPFGIKLGGSTLEYSVAMNGIRMAEGTYDDLGIGTGTSRLNFTSYMDNSKIPSWWASHVDNGEHTTVEIDATMSSSLLPFSVAPPVDPVDVDTDITSAFNSTEPRELNANQPLVSDPVLYLNETSGHWDEVTEQETEIEMDFTLYNPKSYTISASRIGYNMSMNDVYIGDGETTSGVTIPPHESREITATTTIRNQRLDQWWVSHLVRDQRTNLSIDFYAQIGSRDDTFGPITIPLDTMERTFTTDIFGTKASAEAGAESGNGEGDDGTSTDDGAATTDATGEDTPTEGGVIDGTDTPLDGAGGGTDGGTDESTPTPTPSGTDTDDGGLFG